MNPRILLVEDDPVSRAFLTATCEALPAIVDAVDTCSAALACAANASHDLWLVDANLPDGTGAGLLAALRAFAATTAVAHTASHHPADHDALLAAGFVDVLVKPLGTITLHAAIQRALGGSGADIRGNAPQAQAPLPCWDDQAALSALKGEHAHVVALRRLFLDELAGQRSVVLKALADADTLSAKRTLHMLRASCGFVGAARLGDAVRALEGDLQSREAWQRFDEATSALLDAATS